MENDTERYALMMDAYTELQPEIETAHQKKQISVMPALGEVLSDFGPMPDEALFLGVASDELPVLLNLYDLLISNVRSENPVEILAVFFGLVSVLYERKGNILVFPTGIISVLIYVYLCYHAFKKMIGIPKGELLRDILP